MKPLLSALLAIAITVTAVLAFAQFATVVMLDYGTGVFIVLPIVTGALSALIYNRATDHGLGESLAVALLAGVFSLAGFVFFGWEGFICLLMAAPFVLPIFLLGGTLGYYASRLIRSPRARDFFTLMLLAVAPLWSGFAPSGASEPPERVVTSEVVIQATPERVWGVVLAFPPLPPPEEFVFRAGIAYPIRARLEGAGVRAVRYCEFSTGDFVEPITHWEPGRRLAFDVAQQPLPMTEIGLGGRVIHPPHLDWAVRSTRGEFVLEPLPDGRMRLIGRTWYRLKMAPAAYWALWSDELIHTIHLRVLRHIRTEAERA